MDRIIKAVDLISEIPESYIDCGLGQGREVYLAHARKQYKEHLVTFNIRRSQ